MLILTEFLELMPKVRWFVNFKKVYINSETFSEHEYIPELGESGRILVEIPRKRRENRDKAKGTVVTCSETTQ